MNIESVQKALDEMTCPLCFSENIAWKIDSHHEWNWIVEENLCRDCDAIWTENYSLHSVTVNDVTYAVDGDNNENG
jgi:hypothetical protein